MTNTEVLTKLIKERGLKKKKIADELGIGYKTLREKVKNEKPFNAEEINKLCILLEIRSLELKESIFSIEMVDKWTQQDEKMWDKYHEGLQQVKNLLTEELLKKQKDYSMKCFLCPRKCGADRTTERGFCGCTDKISINKAFPHFWEEPCISGEEGSGTVFFSGCSLKCCFCQNFDLSHHGYGEIVSVALVYNSSHCMLSSKCALTEAYSCSS